MGIDETKSGSTPFGDSPHYVVAKSIDQKGNIVIDDPEVPMGSTVYDTNSVLNKSNIKLVTSNIKNYKSGKGTVDENINNDKYFVSGSVIKKYLDDEGALYDTAAAEAAEKKLQDQIDNTKSKVVSVGSQISQSAQSLIDSINKEDSSSKNNTNDTSKSSNNGTTSSISSTQDKNGNNYITNITFNRDDESILGNMNEILKQFKELNETEDSSLETLKEIYKLIDNYEIRRSTAKIEVPRISLDNNGLEPILMGL